MIRDLECLEQFRRNEVKKDNYTYVEALRIFEAMWQEGVALGVLPEEDNQEGIETRIRLAGILNSCLKSY